MSARALSLLLAESGTILSPVSGSIMRSLSTFVHTYFAKPIGSDVLQWL